LFGRPTQNSITTKHFRAATTQIAKCFLAYNKNLTCFAPAGALFCRPATPTTTPTSPWTGATTASASRPAPRNPAPCLDPVSLRTKTRQFPENVIYSGVARNRARCLGRCFEISKIMPDETGIFVVYGTVWPARVSRIARAVVESSKHPFYFVSTRVE